jgi:hypothetical protein
MSEPACVSSPLACRKQLLLDSSGRSLTLYEPIASTVVSAGSSPYVHFLLSKAIPVTGSGHVEDPTLSRQSAHS